MEIKIIPHTHWDREWYFSHLKSRVYSFHDFDEIIKVLESNKDFKCFLLDGQTSIVEEYLEFHPEWTERFKALVKNKRILIGPWYTQTDTMVISGESIIRNLLYGTDYAEKMGHSMEIGYLPDSFGMCEQMPQIYEGFGLRYAMFRRGISDDITKDREFYWLSPNGSKVFTHNIFHYGSMAFPPEDESGIKEFMEDKINLLKDSSITGTIILFNGEDQKPIRKNLPQIIQKMNEVNQEITVQLDSPENIMKDLENSDYPFTEYQGEFTWGQHSRVHKSIFSTRADLKTKNNHMENYLQNICEPIMSIAGILGLPYEKEALKYIWKLMLQNAAHDSIGMCNSDLTNQFIEARFNEAQEFAQNLVELKLREIANHIKQENIFQFQVYNLMGKSRNGYVDMNLYLPSTDVEVYDVEGNQYPVQIENIEDVTEKINKLSIRETGVAGNIKPKWLEQVEKIYLAKVKLYLSKMVAFGYQTLFIRPVEQKSTNINNQSSSNFSIENQIYKISYKEEKHFCLENKKTGQIWEDFLEIQEDGDEGDAYDYSEPDNNRMISELHNVKLQVCKTKFYQKLIVSSCMKVPYDLAQRETKKDSQEMPVVIEITLYQNITNINIITKVLNNQLEHRVRLVIKSNIKSKHSIADEAFGTIQRPVYLGHEDWKEKGWDEKPRTIEPMMSYVALSEKDKTIQVITNGVREYQIIGEDYSEIACTMFRTTPYLGKANLNDRPGRESGNTSLTFDTRMLNQWMINQYNVILYQNKATEYEMAEQARNILVPFIYYQGADFKNNTENLVLYDVENKTFPFSKNFLSLEGDVVLSAFKKAEQGDSYLLRIFNPSSQEKTKFDIEAFTDKRICNLKEQMIEEQEDIIGICEAKSFLLRSNM